MRNLISEYKQNKFDFVHGHCQDVYRNVHLRDDVCDCDALLFTDEMIYEAHKYDGIKIAVLLEVRDIIEYLNNQSGNTRNIYRDIENELLNNQFYKIFTFDRDLLEKGNNKFVFYPFGGCWIPKDDRKIYEKSKSISIISSYKKMTTGHLLRHKIIDLFGKYIDGIFGTGYKYIPQKLDGLKNYKYSIVVENVKRDYYFTEKIIDCFVTGTIPIYYGCPSIGDFFNVNGIITFDSTEDLYKILKNITKNDYNDRIEYIKDNYNLAQQYIERVF